MPIKQTFEEVIANVSSKSSLAEVHGDASIIGIAEYKSQQSGKVSIKIEFKYEGSTFNAYMGLTGKSVDITNGRILKILTKAVGEAKAKEIYTKVASDEDVNDEVELAIGLAQKTNAKLKNNPVTAHVDRVKNGEFWDVKWKIDDNKVEDSGADDFINSMAEED